MKIEDDVYFAVENSQRVMAHDENERGITLLFILIIILLSLYWSMVSV